jgi:hypothetical protein
MTGLLEIRGLEVRVEEILKFVKPQSMGFTLRKISCWIFSNNKY